VRILVIYCHPNEKSFAGALHQTVLNVLRDCGHEVTDLDLYADGFRPVMSREERREYEDPAQYRETVKNYAPQLAEAEAIVAVYPTWWYGLPAMLKGYFDRVWAPGIAFDLGADGVFQTDRLNNIRKLGVVTTYGSPWWLIRLYMGDPERKLWAARSASCAAKAARLTGMSTTTWISLHRRA
jgi:putative NADPH-quinone reductase